MLSHERLTVTAGAPFPRGKVAIIHIPRFDGVTWQNPVSVDPSSAGFDKDWIVCDNWPQSPFYGSCYVEGDDPTIKMSTLTDGSLTWSAFATTADVQTGIDGQPLTATVSS